MIKKLLKLLGIEVREIQVEQELINRVRRIVEASDYQKYNLDEITEEDLMKFIIWSGIYEKEFKGWGVIEDLWEEWSEKWL